MFSGISCRFLRELWARCAGSQGFGGRRFNAENAEMSAEEAQRRYLGDGWQAEAPAPPLVTKGEGNCGIFNTNQNVLDRFLRRERGI
jgi:hypothetical protein